MTSKIPLALTGAHPLDGAEGVRMGAHQSKRRSRRSRLKDQGLAPREAAVLSAASLAQAPAVCERHGRRSAREVERLAEARQRGQGVVIGLVDTGVAKDLTDFRGANLEVREFAGHAMESDHGTHSASILVAQGRRNLLGLSPGARLIAATVSNSFDIAPFAVVATAINWLADSGADIIAIPMGSLERSSVVAEAICRATARGSIVFAAAGNSFPEPIVFPASLANVIAVTATDASGTPLPECSRDPTYEMAVPALRVPGLGIDGRLRCGRGSSVACVVAAGRVAVALSSSSTCGGTRREIFRLLAEKGGAAAIVI